MKTIVNFVINLVIYNLIYGLVAFVAPLILLFIGKKDLEFVPTLFSHPLLSIQIQREYFSSKATIMGFICTSVFASLIFFLSQVIKNVKTRGK